MPTTTSPLVNTTISPLVNRPIQKWQAKLTLLNLPAVLMRWTLTGFRIFIVIFRLLMAKALLKVKLAKRDTRPTILKSFFESAGGSWVKLGQQLAIRIDFLPERLVDELSSLLDDVPPFKYEIAKKMFLEDLGALPESIFTGFSQHPVASASFGQVYTARLDNQKVAIKIQRPGLKKIIVADTLQMKMLAAVADGLGIFGSVRFGPLVKELKSMLEEEADYEWEKANIHDAMNTARNFRIMKVPDLVPEYSGGRIITMEYLEGVWVNDVLDAMRNHQSEKIDKWESEGVDFKLIARRIFDIGMRQIFEVRKFNADPHAANIVIMKDNVVGYVDYGLIGSVGKYLLDNQMKYFEAVYNNKADDAAQMMLKLVIVPRERSADVDDFRRELSMQIQSWISNSIEPGIPLSYKSTARLMLENIALIRKYRFSLANNVARYYRALITSDVIIMQLDKEFNFPDNMRRYFANKLIRETRMNFKKAPLEKLSMEYFLLFLRGPGIIRKFEEQADESSDFVDETQNRMKRWLGTLEVYALIALFTVLIARVFGVEDVGKLIAFPFPLNWRWTSIALYILWRSFRVWGG